METESALQRGLLDAVDNAIARVEGAALAAGGVVVPLAVWEALVQARRALDPAPAAPASEKDPWWTGMLSYKRRRLR